MAQQEDGWPLGLQPLNMRIGLIRNREFSGSISFNSIITGSSSYSSDSSSDLDTESSGSFFHDKSITLGSLIAASTTLEIQGRPANCSGGGERRPNSKKNQRTKPWFSLCAKPQIDGENSNPPPSLGLLLEVERRAADFCKRDPNSFSFVLHELPQNPSLLRTNSLFGNCRIAVPRRVLDYQYGSDARKRFSRATSQPDGRRVPTLSSCVRGLFNH